MVMETQPKLRRIPSMFRTSFASCSSRTLSDVIDKFLSRPLPRPFPAVRRPSPTAYVHPPDPTRPLTLGDVLKGRLCPAVASPVAPPTYTFHEKRTKRGSKKTETEFQDWFSSDDEREEEEEEDETETLFSSRSLSSDSSGRSHRRRSRRRVSLNQTRVGIKDSFAVVKKSSDPHKDFRNSMVEMIVEKEMFGEEELERLLQCFLSLNSHHHHAVIVEVFAEIWEALFPHWS